MGKVSYRTISVRIPEDLMEQVEEMVPVLMQNRSSTRAFRVIGNASKNTVLQLAIELGMERLKNEILEARYRERQAWHEWAPLPELKKRLGLARDRDERAKLLWFIETAEAAPERWAAIGWWTKEARSLRDEGEHPASDSED